MHRLIEAIQHSTYRACSQGLWQMLQPKRCQQSHGAHMHELKVEQLCTHDISQTNAF